MISIDSESVDIYIENGFPEEPTHICYWHVDEVFEDPNLAITIANAVHMFHTDPKLLCKSLQK